MDYQLKGLILNRTLKSYAITPIESPNVLKSQWSCHKEVLLGL